MYDTIISEILSDKDDGSIEVYANENIIQYKVVHPSFNYIIVSLN